MLAWQEIGGNIDQFGPLLGIGLLIFLAFHISAFLAILYQFRFFRKVDVLRAMTLFVGVISFLLIFSDLAMLQDIFKEYKLGWETKGEWLIVYINHAIHSLFLVMSIILNYSALKYLKSQKISEPIFKDESLFISTQYIGIASGVAGLSVLCLNSVLNLPLEIFTGVSIVLCIIVLAPYCLASFYWFLIKSKEKDGEWYDEKQFTDITKAGFATLVFSLPCLAVLYYLDFQSVENVLSFLWFPFYVFFSLLLFSGSTLYFSTRS